MTPSTTLDTRGLAPGLAPTISVVNVDYDKCDIICDTLALAPDPTFLGVSVRLSQNRGAIEAIALATPHTVYSVNIPKHTSTSKPKNPKLRRTDLVQVLEHPKCLLAGVRVPRLALLVQRKTGAHVLGVELLALPAKTESGRPPTVADLVYTHLSHRTKKQRIHSLWLRNSNIDLCLKAWLMASIAGKCVTLLKTYRKVDTRKLKTFHLAWLSQLVLNIELLDAEKPTSADGEFEAITTGSQGELKLTNSRYKTRVRRSFQTIIEINGGEVKARAQSTKGKSTGLVVLHGKLPVAGATKVRVVGREEATNSERARDDFLLRVLQGEAVLHHSPFVRLLWIQTVAPKKCKKKESARVATPPSFELLNPSQKRVALAMISNDEPLVIAHGPPGTGKTSTIAVALEYWQSERDPAWVIAHSNVGVQNIAETLFKRGVDFKIIVSKEFHCEWHEHLYEDIEHRLIRSDEIVGAFDPRTAIADSTVILCTLSMLSNPSLDLYGVFAYVPVVRLVVDEASQIDTFEFMHLFDKFAKPQKPATPPSKKVEKSTSLVKVCMFGDPKQLPPFGADTAPQIKTIFDFKQFKLCSYFLDTQYRMPVPVGDFISKEVYESKLNSVHKINDSSCVRFIDVRKGGEQRVGQSWKNTEEANTIVNLVKKYYKDLDWCVITPYDAQRAAITAALKTAGVQRHDYVYNVDSFQGMYIFSPYGQRLTHIRLRRYARQATKRHTSSSPPCARRPRASSSRSTG
ncbi:P-loop containing nucleoside triphosphate hydrolase protein [Daedaleopsis nitida]|nr:P-loop containing nucleoside triphosphate hydrolase protein [Daedaleopsis nitida]